MPKGNKWKKEDIEFLLDNYLKLDYRVIAKHLNRTSGSIYTKCSDLKLKKHYKKEIVSLPMTFSLAYILGCLCGDASMLPNQIRLMVVDQDFADEFYNHCNIVLNKLINITRRYNKGLYYVQLSSLGLNEYLLNNYGNFKTFVWKVLPEIYYSDDKYLIGYFLKGFFDSEGSIRRYEIRACSVCSSIKDIGFLLNQLGIVNKIVIENRRTKAGNKVYCISITGARNLRLFMELVGCSIQRKSKILRYLNV